MRSQRSYHESSEHCTIGTILGSQAVENRKTESRIEEAHADSNLNTEVIQLTKEKADVELAYARYKADTELELEKVRCEDKPCPWRRPPNAYTEPQGKTKEDYHNEKD